jgi:hypothetical protein
VCTQAHPPGIVHVSCGNFHVLHMEHFGMSRS